MPVIHWCYFLEIIFPIFTLPVPAAIRAELRQQQSRTKGRMIDLADQDQVHQQLVDQTLHELGDIYDQVTPIKTMQGDNLRLPEDIAADISVLAHEVVEA